MALEGRLRRHGAAVWLPLIKPMLVSSFITPLDTHERLGPAGATPGVGNLLELRPRTPI